MEAVSSLDDVECTGPGKDLWVLEVEIARSLSAHPRRKHNNRKAIFINR